jgi:predicted ATP-grasp superfamily ATP-dependent carboligase
MTSVLVVEDGFGPHPLAAVRAFGRAGWQVAVGSPQRAGRAVRSRWTRRWHEVPPAERDVAAFLAATVAAVDEGAYDLVFGGDDVEVLALSLGRDRLPACFPYAAHDLVVRAMDKVHLTEAAARAGLSAPPTSTSVQALDPPVYVKPRLHWAPGARSASARLPVRLCTTRDEAAAAADEIVIAGGQPLFQTPVPGRLTALTGVVHEGRLLAPVQQVAVRESPEWRNSVRAETVPLDADLAARAQALLAHLGWSGLANLQFLQPPGGELHLTDLNGRFYGSMALALASGVNHPVLWARLALSQSPGPLPTARVGVRYQVLEEDLRRAFAERRGGLVRDLASCLRYAPGAAHGTWSSADPGPAAYRGAAAARESVRRVGGSTGLHR